MNTADYQYVSHQQPHPRRGKEILLKYPQVRELIGPNPWTTLCIVGLVAGQIVMAALLSGSSWWVITLMAYLIGAFPNHALYVMIHECTHNLLWKGPTANRIMGIVCDMALVVPSAMGFRTFHLLHHQFLGTYERDADLASHTEARLVGNHPLKKALWIFFFMFSQGIFRPARLQSVPLWNKWVVLNLFSQILVNGLIFFTFGSGALLYLFLSTFFSLGLHPLGGRWIQEHYTFTKDQETYSYYGPLNKLTFNIGYHNEHHDLMMIPWNRLSHLKKLAPEFYDQLYSHRSWTHVLWQFIFDKKMSPYSRIVHPFKKTMKESPEMPLDTIYRKKEENRVSGEILEV